MVKDFSLNSKEKKICLELARRSIEYSLNNYSVLKLSEKETQLLPKKLFEERACFVTLKLNNQLRGCIGNLIPFEELYRGIIKNAFSAAFNDPRFTALRKEELEGVEIEISILTNPKKLSYTNEKDLLKKITKKDGLIISKGPNSATFLPSVWEEIPSKEDFLSYLCQKAGLGKNEWKNGALTVQTYRAITVK